MGSPMGGWCSPAEVEICSREKEVLDWASVIAVGRSLDLGRQAGRGALLCFPRQPASERLSATIITN